MTSKHGVKRAKIAKDAGLLRSKKIVAFIPTTDFKKARNFYEGVLGLGFVSDDGFALVFDANGTMLRIAKVPDLKPAQFTILGWQVSKIKETVAELKARGVKFENYGMKDQDSDGVWSAPGGAAKVAWFKDPDGNVLSISQHG
jgi:catechol 2,3-dioxygenase-like lactoylglutathione lyase family enzyme